MAESFFEYCYNLSKITISCKIEQHSSSTTMTTTTQSTQYDCVILFGNVLGSILPQSKISEVFFKTYFANFDIQTQIKNYIAEEYNGEIPLYSSFILPIDSSSSPNNNNGIRFVIFTSCCLKGNQHTYSSMSSCFSLIRTYNKSNFS